MKLKPCPFCGGEDDLSMPAGAHDFRLIGSTLYYFDSELGWEGMEANFCPLCGRALSIQADKPLTLDELRQMDGEPVWVVFKPDFDGTELKMWALVRCGDETDSVTLRNNLGGHSYYEDVQNDIKAIYRQRPEEVS